jgi:hypothetical protein
VRGAQIVVRCPECGDARVAPEEVTVRSCVDNSDWSYRFTCPRCLLPTVGQSRIEPLLDAVSAGAGLESWTLPVETHDQDAPLFTDVDILELHLLMIEPDWLDELRRYDLEAGR